MVILDLSKVIMYSCFYDHVKSKYKNRVALCATDTDSLILEVKTDDIYRDMMHDKQLYDLSNYNRCHPLFDETNMGKLGTVKDETKGLPIHKFIGLRSKMYACVCPSAAQKEHVLAKGVKKSTIKSDLTFDMYYNCLFDKRQEMSSMHLIKSVKHRLGINRLSKTSLCAADDKRWILEDGISTFAHGFHSTTTN